MCQIILLLRFTLVTLLVVGIQQKGPHWLPLIMKLLWPYLE